MRSYGFVKGIAAEVGGFIDGIRLADRIEDDSAFLGDVVDRELNGGGKTPDNEVHLFLFDQFQGPRRRFPGIDLVAPHAPLRAVSPAASFNWAMAGWPART